MLNDADASIWLLIALIDFIWVITNQLRGWEKNLRLIH